MLGFLSYDRFTSATITKPTVLSGPAAAYVAPNAEEHYRSAYFLLTDTTVAQLDTRFKPESHGLLQYLTLEDLLCSGQVSPNIDVVSDYPELDTTRLAGSSTSKVPVAV